MAKICIQMLIHGIKPNICIGPENCGQWALCNGIVTVHKPKQAVRTINMEDM